MYTKNSLLLCYVVCGLCGIIDAKKLIGPLLLSLEKNICRMIEQPEPVFSDRLILDVIYYCRTIIKLNYMIDNRSDSAKAIAKYLFNEGSPTFLEKQTHAALLINNLHWKDEDVKNLQFLFDKVRMLWIEFHKTYKRNIVWFV